MPYHNFQLSEDRKRIQCRFFSCVKIRSYDLIGRVHNREPHMIDTKSMFCKKLL